MQISIVLLIFLLFLDQILEGGQKLYGGACWRKPDYENISPSTFLIIIR